MAETGLAKVGLFHTTCYSQSKLGVEIRIESVNKDISHLWVRISHGLNKLLADLIDQYDDNEQNEDGNICVCKNQRSSTICSSSRTVPFLERTWTDIQPGNQFDQAYPVAKRLNTLLRHGELLREEDSAIECWTLKNDLRHNFEYSQYWSDDVWKSKMSGGGGNKNRFQIAFCPIFVHPF